MITLLATVSSSMALVPEFRAALVAHPSTELQTLDFKPPQSPDAVQGFKADFLWPGTCDWTAWAAVPAALAVQHMWGLDSMRRYNHDMLLRALRLLGSSFKLAAVLGTPALLN